MRLIILLYNNDNNYYYFMNTINGMENKEKSNEIIMKYKLDKGKKEINIFGHIFVEKNKNNCKLI